MKTNRLTCEKARDISIVSTLENLGYSPKRKTEKEAWFLSPFRSETEASFKVDLRINRWYDHGVGKGGNIIDLIMELNSFSVSKALEFLNGNINSFLFHEQVNSQPQKEYQIDRIKKLNNSALLQYLESRKINLNIAKKYCQEIYYKSKSKSYFAIAFKNELDGFEIRNKYFKGCIGTKGISHVKNGSNSISVFEGFIDFLSYLSLKEIPKKFEDYLVLNSISNAEKSIHELKNYSSVFIYLDNDMSGLKASKFLKANIKTITDCSFIYSNYNDVNDYLKSTKHNE